MGRSLAELIEGYSCVAIIGMEKNAGKTTVLNHLLSSRPPVVQAITSIGYDGEDTDQVTGTDKPSIYVGCGTMVATASSLLGQCDFTRELLRFTGFHTPMGEVIITRARSDGFAQIAGPSTTVQMSALIGMLHELGATQVLVDGAAARKSTAAIASSEACILATGAAFSPNPDDIVEQTGHYTELLTLPEFEHETAFTCRNEDANSCILLDQSGNICGLTSALSDECADRIADRNGQPTTALFNGAVTRPMLQKLLGKCRRLDWLQIVAEDGTRYLINSRQKLDLTSRGASLAVRRQVNLIAVTVNPTAPSGLRLDGAELCRHLSERIDLPVFDVCASENQIFSRKAVQHA